MKCCICGAVKNVGQYLDKIFENIEKIGSLFEDYVILLYYDASDDDTLQKMKEYQQKNNKLCFYINNNKVSKYRTHRIANARNWCLHQIKQKYTDWDFFIMIDCDDVCSQPIKLPILHQYLNRNDWDSLSFNKSHYYDIWALSIRPYIFSFAHFDPQPVENMINYITNKLKRLPNNSLLKCASAFNGFAIYRINKFLNCKYDGRPRFDLIPKNLLLETIRQNKSRITNKRCSMNEDCEHRSFHLEAIKKNNARIRISPEIIF